MSRLRFTTAHEVLDAFESAREDIGVELADSAPVRYLDALAKAGFPLAALSFCAYLLPRREAVAWGCRSVRALWPDMSAQQDRGLEAAERWVQRPDDAARRAALSCAMGGDLRSATAWLALGAGWAGGSMAPGEHAVPSPPHLTARAVRASLLMALGRADQARRHENIVTCLELGRRFAEDEERL